MNFIIYNSTGTILRTGSCPNSMLSIQAQNGETVIEGQANQNAQYISDGVVTNYTEAELVSKQNIPYGYKWDIATMSAVKTLTDEEINTYLGDRIRAKRDQLLKDAVDRLNPIWWNSMTPEKQTEWAVYRQDLLDITSQSGFPQNVVWPTKPS